MITSSHSSSWIASHCRSFTVLHSSTCRKFNQSSVLIVLMIKQYHYDWYYEYMNVFLAKTMLTRKVELNCGFVAMSWGQFLELITVIVDEILITRSRLVKDLCWWELKSSVCITLQIQIQTSSVTHSSSWTSRQTYPTRWCKNEHIIIIIILILVIIILIVKFKVAMIFMMIMIIMGGLFQWKFSIPYWWL